MKSDSRFHQKQFLARYRIGVFIGFHGSSDRALFVQVAYDVVVQEFDGSRESGGCESVC